MSSRALAYVTGHPQIDRALQGMIDILEAVFPGRIRAYYLVGSYADGSAAPVSDVDVRAVFQDDFVDKAELERFLHIRQALRRLSSVPIDMPPLSEARLRHDENWLHETISIKQASCFLHGEDIGASLPDPEFHAYVRNVTAAPVLFFTKLHGNVARLLFPLDYPDPGGEFYGYDTLGGSLAPEKIADTKMLVHCAGFAATCLIALDAGRIVVKKSDWLPLYQTTVNDEWTGFLTSLYEQCKTAWGYRIPEHATERALLRELCRRMLAFENHYLERYCRYLLGELASLEPARQIFAVRRLAQAIYPGDRVLDALQTLQATDDELRLALEETIPLYLEQGLR
jgi:hypothetical protein